MFTFQECAFHRESEGASHRFQYNPRIVRATVATAGFHLFVSLTDVQGSQTPQLNTSCTLGREQTTFMAGIACPASLLGAICLREPPQLQGTPQTFPVQMHIHCSPAEIPPGSLALPGSGAEKHIYAHQP